MGNTQKSELQTIATNKKAFHDYFIIESSEAGIELFGTEVKSVCAHLPSRCSETSTDNTF